MSNLQKWIDASTKWKIYELHNLCIGHLDIRKFCVVMGWERRVIAGFWLSRGEVLDSCGDEISADTVGLGQWTEAGRELPLSSVLVTCYGLLSNLWATAIPENKLEPLPSYPVGVYAKATSPPVFVALCVCNSIGMSLLFFILFGCPWSLVMPAMRPWNLVIRWLVPHLLWRCTERKRG